MGAAVCRRLDDQCWVQGGTAGKGKTLKTEMEKKGLRVNMGKKTKIMESGINLDVLKKSGKYPCGVCLTGVGSTMQSSVMAACAGCIRKAVA